MDYSVIKMLTPTGRFPTRRHDRRQNDKERGGCNKVEFSCFETAQFRYFK